MLSKLNCNDFGLLCSKTFLLGICFTSTFYLRETNNFGPKLLVTNAVKTAQPIRCHRPLARPLATDRLGSFGSFRSAKGRKKALNFNFVTSNFRPLYMNNRPRALLEPCRTI